MIILIIYLWDRTGVVGGGKELEGGMLGYLVINNNLLINDGLNYFNE